MKKLVIFALVVCLGMYARAATSITTPSVSGHWTLAGSPYKIYNDINIPTGQSLIIDKGVEVVFQGYYGLDVFGTLNAVGNGAQPIRFHVQDTLGWYNSATKSGGWSGIHFGEYGIPTISKSTVSSCSFTDMKEGAFTVIYTSLSITQCNFYHNNGSVLSAISDSSNTFEMTSCYVHDNISQSRLIMFMNVNVNMNKCSIYDNNTNLDLLYATMVKFSFENNMIYGNTQHDTTMASAVFITDSRGVVKSNKIYENTSVYDGALSCMHGQVDIIGNYICNNQTLVGFNGSSACGSIEGGGGIRVSSEGALDTSTYFNIHNNVIANNHAAFKGGGIYVMFANVNITNNTMVNNDGGDDAHIFIFNTSVYGPSKVAIKNNIFYNANGIHLKQVNVGVQAADTLLYEHNWTQYGFSKDLNFTGFGCNKLICDSLTNTIGTAPGLINSTKIAIVTESALNSDFRLLPSSPCINIGDSTFGKTGTIDFSGRQRIYGIHIDIGACEYNPVWFATTGSSMTEQNEETTIVYPNPAHNTLSMAVPEATGYILISDVAGRTIKQQPVQDRVTAIDISDIANGIYLAIWNNGTSLTTRKFVVQ